MYSFELFAKERVASLLADSRARGERRARSRAAIRATAGRASRTRTVRVLVGELLISAGSTIEGRSTAAEPCAETASRPA